MKLFSTDLFRALVVGFLIGAAGFGISLAINLPAGANDIVPTHQAYSYP